MLSSFLLAVTVVTQQLPGDVTLTTCTFPFENNKATVRPEDLDVCTKAVPHLPYGMVFVTASASLPGPTIYNKKLSEKRGDFILSSLLEKFPTYLSKGVAVGTGEDIAGRMAVAYLYQHPKAKPTWLVEKFPTEITKLESRPEKQFVLKTYGGSTFYREGKPTWYPSLGIGFSKKQSSFWSFGADTHVLFRDDLRDVLTGYGNIELRPFPIPVSFAALAGFVSIPSQKEDRWALDYGVRFEYQHPIGDNLWLGGDVTFTRWTTALGVQLQIAL